MDVHDRFKDWQDRLLRIQLRPDIPPAPKAFVEKIGKAVHAASTLFSDTHSVLRETGDDALDHELAFRNLMCVEKQRNALWNLLNNVVDPGESRSSIHDEWWSGETLGTLWEIRREIADDLDKMSEFDEAWIERRAFNDAIRPFARPLSIHDLSIELWTMVFEQVAGEADGPPWLFPEHAPGGPSPIKDIRLVCRLFCDASSHLLFRRVDLALRPDSLERLDKISRHSLFSASVRAVRIDLAGYDYRDDLSEDESKFMAASIEAGESLLSWCHMAHLGSRPHECILCLLQVGLSETQTADVFHSIKRTLGVWKDYLRLESANPSLDDDEVSAETRVAMLAVRECHQEYRKRCQDQDYRYTRGSDLARSVAEAIARMPKVVRLCMTDEMGPAHSSEVQLLPIGTPVEDLAQDPRLLLRETMLEPRGTGAIAQRDVHLTGRLLHLVLMALHQAGVPLLHLELKFSSYPVTTADLDAKGASSLRGLAKTLKSFDYRGRPDFPLLDASNEQAYLSALASGPNLETLQIGFLLDRAVTMSIDPVLASLWSGSKLRSITLRDCSFHLHQLQSVLENCKPNNMTLVALHGTRLESGTWADALDALREAATDRTTVAYVDRPGGAECDNMSREQYNLIFLSGFDQPYKHSKANKYISSSFCSDTQNPLRPEPVDDVPSPAGQTANNDT